MGKTRLIAETGAGQHGVATATVAALLGLECDIYMGTEDIRRQRLNVIRMRLLGARVIPVESGSRTLKDAMNEAIRDWVTNVRHTHYVLGSVGGPHPYPMIVRDFQAVIGREAKAQLHRLTGRLPQCLVACVGGGSNAMGLFHAFVDDPVRFVGVEAAGHGLSSGHHSATLVAGTRGGAARRLQLSPARPLGQHPGGPFPGAGAGLPRGRPGALLFQGHRQGRIRGGDRYRGPGRVSDCSPGPRAFCRPWRAPTRWPICSSWPPNIPPADLLSSTSPAGVTKTWRQWPRLWRCPVTRIDQVFKRLKAKGERALIPFITAGDPDLATTRALALEMAARGADLLELGIPFSDPLADGPTIQAASNRASAAWGCTWRTSCSWRGPCAGKRKFR